MSELFDHDYPAPPGGIEVGQVWVGILGQFYRITFIGNGAVTVAPCYEDGKLESYPLIPLKSLSTDRNRRIPAFRFHKMADQFNAEQPSENKPFKVAVGQVWEARANGLFVLVVKLKNRKREVVCNKCNEYGEIVSTRKLPLCTWKNNEIPAFKFVGWAKELFDERHENKTHDESIDFAKHVAFHFEEADPMGNCHLLMQSYVVLPGPTGPKLIK